ncbi:EF-hand domain-containing protein [Actibacterium sp. D379-3]
MKTMIMTLTAALVCAGAAFAEIDMAAIDTDGDGSVSLEELLVEYPEQTGESFAALDSDSDGMLSEAELVAADEAGLLPVSE